VLRDAIFPANYLTQNVTVMSHCTNPLRGNSVVTTVVSVHFRAL